GVALGTSVAISGDTIVAGTYQDAGFQGAAYVFVKPSSGWANATETAKLTASDGDRFQGLGYSVAVSGDTVVAGAPYFNQGAVYVFEKPSTGWASGTETAKLTASDGTAYTGLGYSVAVSGDTVAAGAPPAAYVFVRPPGGWANATETEKLTPTNPGDYSGF